MLKDFTPRLYQETILNTCVGKNTLVVLPTGLGKTAIAMMLAAQRLHMFPNSKIVFLAPTKPLAEQHLQSFRQNFDIADDKMALFTGDTSPAERAEQWNNINIVFATPQGIENDVLGSKISLKNVSLIIFDEAHRATGDYSYVFLAKHYQRQADFSKILALTASPGAEVLKIEEICKNLFIEAVEVRTDQDADVKPYVQETDITTIKLELPAGFKTIQQHLNNCVKSKLEEIKRYGLTKTISLVSKRELLGLQMDLQARLANGERDFETMKSLSLAAEAMKAHHALDLLETQCISALNEYFQKVFEEAKLGKSKAVKNLAEDNSFKTAFSLTQTLVANNIDHPKLAAARDICTKILAENKMAKIILFTQYRDTAVYVQKELEKASILSEVFVGQAKVKTTGLSQKKQIEMLAHFKDGMFSVLIATSVAEEGLDIPRVDSVIFYEPVPSAIRTIQRRGRTGRQEKGNVVMLIAKGTRDEAYSWSAKTKERAMNNILIGLKNTMMPTLPVQQKLVQDSTVIYADYREKSSGVVKELVEFGVDLKLEMLNTADYILSSRVAVEFKTAKDFVDSIVDGRLLDQLKSLKENYARPIVVVEGTEDLYALRNIHANAIRGMLATITINYGIPVLRTKDPKDTAAILAMIAKREQTENTSHFSPHASKKPITLKESQEYVISSLPAYA